MTTHQIGANIRKRRLQQGHTNYRVFAKENGINASILHRVECGEDTKISTLLKISHALNIEPQELLK